MVTHQNGTVQIGSLSKTQSATIKELARYEKQNLDLALQLAAARIPIFPMGLNLNERTGRWDKRPAIDGWRTKTSPHPIEIMTWWNKNPRAVPAIELERAGLVVVDVDRHGGPDGLVAFEQLVAKYGYLPTGPVTLSAGNGKHFFFRQPAQPLASTTKNLPLGVEIKGVGGSIIAPGAIRPDGACWSAEPGSISLIEAIAKDKLPTLPDWLVDIVNFKPRAETLGKPTLQAPTLNRERAYALAALDACATELGDCVVGQRNQKLNAVAYRMATMVPNGWVEAPEVADALRDACLANGLIADDGEDSVQHTLSSAFDAGFKNPHPPLAERGPVAQPGVAPSEPLGEPPLEMIWEGDPWTPQSWLARDLLPENCLALFAGESQAGKSYLAVDLAVAVATGQPFFGKRVREGGVVYVAGEASNTIQERLAGARLGRNLGESSSANKLPISLVCHVPDLTNAANRKKLISRISDAEEAIRERFDLPLKLIVVDTLIASFAISNWNDPAEASKVTRGLIEIQKGSGVTVLGVHHHGKDVKRGATGSFVFTAAPDTIISVMKEEESTGVVRSREIVITKQRSGPTGWRCGFGLEDHTVAYDDEGESVVTKAVVPLSSTVGAVKASNKKPKKNVAALRESLTEALKSHGKQQQLHGSGPAVFAVTRDVVRQFFDARYTTDSETPEKRKDSMRHAFKRAVDELIDAEQLKQGHWNGTDWLWAPDL